MSNLNLPSIVVGSLEDINKSEPIIVTHDGRFHCDDVMAVGLLLQLPEYKNANIIRTRNPEIWKKASIIVDVGGVYDPDNNKFDHHQRDFSIGFRDLPELNVTKMSSVGMIYKHFGKRILLEAFNIPSSYLDEIYNNIYEVIIESIDALDNGVDISDTPVKYIIRTDITSRIARLNKDWNDQFDNNVQENEFKKAIEIGLEEFTAHINFYIKSWLPAKKIVEKGFKNRFNVHSSGRIIELESGCPFEKEIKNEEIKSGIISNNDDIIPNGILFVIFPYDIKKNDWRVKSIKKDNSFQDRLSLPERGRGLGTDELEKLGFHGIRFIHHAGFLAGATSRDACLNLINITLKEANL